MEHVVYKPTPPPISTQHPFTNLPSLPRLMSSPTYSPPFENHHGLPQRKNSFKYSRANPHTFYTQRFVRPMHKSFRHVYQHPVPRHSTTVPYYPPNRPFYNGDGYQHRYPRNNNSSMRKTRSFRNRSPFSCKAFHSMQEYVFKQWKLYEESFPSTSVCSLSQTSSPSTSVDRSEDDCCSSNATNSRLNSPTFVDHTATIVDVIHHSTSTSQLRCNGSNNNAFSSCCLLDSPIDQLNGTVINTLSCPNLLNDGSPTTTDTDRVDEHVVNNSPSKSPVSLTTLPSSSATECCSFAATLSTDDLVLANSLDKVNLAESSSGAVTSNQPHDDGQLDFINSDDPIASASTIDNQLPDSDCDVLQTTLTNDDCSTVNCTATTISSSPSLSSRRIFHLPEPLELVQDDDEPSQSPPSLFTVPPPLHLRSSGSSFDTTASISPKQSQASTPTTVDFYWTPDPPASPSSCTFCPSNDPSPSSDLANQQLSTSSSTDADNEVFVDLVAARNNLIYNFLLLMAELEIGLHCAHPDCNRLDFLPIQCDLCRQTFCKTHSSRLEHECLSDSDLQQQLRPDHGESTVDESVECSFESCRNRLRLPLQCDHCRGLFCIEHKQCEVHQCPNTPTAIPLVKHDIPEIDRAALDSVSHTNVSSKTTSDPQHRHVSTRRTQTVNATKLRLRLMTCRMKAIAGGRKAGELNRDDRFVLRLIDGRSNNGGDKSPAFVSSTVVNAYFGKNWPFGRVVDFAVDTFKAPTTKSYGLTIVDEDGSSDVSSTPDQSESIDPNLTLSDLVASGTLQEADLLKLVCL